MPSVAVGWALWVAEATGLSAFLPALAGPLPSEDGQVHWRGIAVLFAVPFLAVGMLVAYGAEAYGAEAYGAEAYGAEAYGAEAYGTEAYGTEAYGTEAYGTEAYGTEAYGTEAYGTEASWGESAAAGDRSTFAFCVAAFLIFGPGGFEELQRLLRQVAWIWEEVLGWRAGLGGQ